MDLEALIRVASQGARDERVAAIHRIADVRSKKAVGPLVQLLRSDDAAIRLAVCDALGQIGDTRAVPPLVSMLRDDSEEIRGEAFSSLLLIGQSRAEFIPAEAIRSGNLQDPSAALTQIMWPADLEAIELLTDALHDDDPEVRIGSIYTLGRIGVSKVSQQIQAIMTTDTDADVRAAAAFALGDLREVGDRSATEALIEQWPSSRTDTEVAVTLIRSLANRPVRAALAIFVDALRHADDRVRQLAAMGLWQLGGAETAVPLTKALQDPSIEVQRIAIGALGKIGHRDIIHALIAHGVRAPADLRLSIGEALKQCEAETVVSSLNQTYTTGDDATRACAIFLMGQIGDSHGVYDGLYDPAPGVRKSAALAMGSVGDASYADALMKCLDDPEWAVRVAGAEGLKRMKAHRSIPVLESHLDDSHPVVRNAIRVAIDSLSKSRRDRL